MCSCVVILRSRLTSMAMSGRLVNLTKLSWTDLDLRAHMLNRIKNATLDLSKISQLISHADFY